MLWQLKKYIYGRKEKSSAGSGFQPLSAHGTHIVTLRAVARKNLAMGEVKICAPTNNTIKNIYEKIIFQ